MSICTKNGCISWSTRSSSMGGCRPFLCNFVGEWKAQLKERWKIHKKTAFFECSRMCNFFITMLLERKIGIYTNHNRLYLWSHFQRYSHTCIEDIYTNLVKSSVSPYILISTHLYLLCRDDSRAEISREEHGHIYVRVYKISGAFIPRHRRYAYASDHKTLYFFLKSPHQTRRPKVKTVSWLILTRTRGDICAYFKKRNVSDERKYSLVVSLRTQIRKN